VGVTLQVEIVVYVANYLIFYYNQAQYVPTRQPLSLVCKKKR